MTVDFGDSRIRELVELQSLWPDVDLRRRVDQAIEKLRSGLSCSNPKDVWLGVGGMGHRLELNLYHYVYRRPDIALAGRTLSTICHAYHLAHWGKFVTAPDPEALRAPTDYMCEHGMLSSWLGHREALAFACKRLAHLVPLEMQEPGALDTAHLNFCTELLNAQAIAPSIPSLPDPDDDAMYLALPFPKDDRAVSLQTIQSVLDQRIQRSFNMEKDGGVGAHFYLGAHRSLFPFELLAYYRWFKEEGRLSADVALHPMLEYFDQFHYDPSAKSEPVLVEVEKFIESRRLR